MLVDNRYLEHRRMKSVSGNDYLVLLLLINVKTALKKKEVEELLSMNKSKKCCMSRPTLSKSLNNLLQKNFVLYDNAKDKYFLNPKTYKPEYTTISPRSLEFAINKQISPATLKTYLCLMLNWQKGKETTYEYLAMYSGMDESNIGRYVHNLEDVGLIRIENRVGKRGVFYNVYFPQIAS